MQIYFYYYQKLVKANSRGVRVHCAFVDVPGTCWQTSVFHLRAHACHRVSWENYVLCNSTHTSKCFMCWLLYGLSIPPFSFYAQTCHEHVSHILLSQQLLVLPPTQSTINKTRMSCGLHKAQPVLIHMNMDEYSIEVIQVKTCSKGLQVWAEHFCIQILLSLNPLT